jgi:hypothetical protein
MAPDQKTVEDYIGTYPEDRQQLLQQVRSAIHRGVPDAAEKIRYGMPAVMLGGRYAIHFAGWDNHIGLYAVPSPDAGRAAANGDRAVPEQGRAGISVVGADPGPLDRARIRRHRRAASVHQRLRPHTPGRA